MTLGLVWDEDPTVGLRYLEAHRTHAGLLQITNMASPRNSNSFFLRATLQVIEQWDRKYLILCMYLYLHIIPLLYVVFVFQISLAEIPIWQCFQVRFSVMPFYFGIRT